MNNDRRTLFVGNLSEQVTDDILHELFLQAGPIQQVSIPQMNGKSRNFGFVVFKHECSVPYSIALMSSTSLYGRMLNLKTKRGNCAGPYTPQPILIGYINKKQRFGVNQNSSYNPLRGMTTLKRSQDNHMKPHSHRHSNKHSKPSLHGKTDVWQRLESPVQNQDTSYTEPNEDCHKKHNSKNQYNRHSQIHNQKPVQPKHIYFTDDDSNNRKNRKGNSDPDTSLGQYLGDPFVMQPYNF